VKARNYLSVSFGSHDSIFARVCVVVSLFISILIFHSDSFSKGYKKMEFTNPILAGFYPDPSICRVGDDYYLVNSTFAYYPGIPVFHSKDLVNWRLIGYVIDRPDELNYDSLGVSRGIFAPAIRYHDGTFYVTCTFVDGGGNFVCTAKNPAGPWSKPVWLPQVSGIDPSLFFDNDGKAYLVYNSVAPDNRPLYNGHRTIRIRSFDTHKLAVNDDEKILVNGGTDIEEKPQWIEGPHIFKVGEYYFLICAQGGTQENHSEVVFKSKSVWGPYHPYEDNPILTQRDLNPKRKDPITCTGHADFVETQNGTWWAVFLGCQPYPPYEKDYYNTGRETFLAPVTWKNGWPTIVPHGHEVSYHYPFPLHPFEAKGELRYSGDIEYIDSFDSDKLDLNWEFLRAPHERWYSLSKKRGYLAIRLRPETVSGKMNPSFLGRRQQNKCCSASTALEFSPNSENEKAGLIVFQNETHFYYLCVSMHDGQKVVQLFKSIDTSNAVNNMELIASQAIGSNNVKKEVYLRIEASGPYYFFSYSVEPDKWVLIRTGSSRNDDRVDASYLSTNVAGGFVGCMFGLYATSLGAETNNTAYYNWFKYKGEDGAKNK
jgi:xylan 1,4-beta-xylosidase